MIARHLLTVLAVGMALGPVAAQDVKVELEATWERSAVKVSEA